MSAQLHPNKSSVGLGVARTLKQGLGTLTSGMVAGHHDLVNDMKSPGTIAHLLENSGTGTTNSHPSLETSGTAKTHSCDYHRNIVLPRQIR